MLIVEKIKPQTPKFIDSSTRKVSLSENETILIRNLVLSTTKKRPSFWFNFLVTYFETYYLS